MCVGSLISTAGAQEAPAPPPKVGDVSMHGYVRLGFGGSGEGGRMVCFKVPGALAKYRLGNECEQYTEFMLSAPAYVGADGFLARANVMFAGFAPTSIGHGASFTPPAGSTGTGADWALPNIFLDMPKVSFLRNGTPWVGRRYYKREDIYLSDFFYWNPSGLGGGIEDVEIGRLRFSYALFAVDGPGFSAGPPAPAIPRQNDLGYRNDLQLRGIPINPGGELQLGVSAILDGGNDPATHSGFSVTVRHVQNVLGGNNKLVVQYGVGPGTGLGGADPLTNRTDRSRLRVIELLSFQPTASVGGQAVFVFQHDELDPGTQDWYSAGGRVSISFSEHVKLLFDFGHDTVQPDTGASRSLTKLGIAPAITTGRGFFMRPELRLFFNYWLWNEAARAAGIDNEGLYTMTDKTTAATFGIHGESWW